MIRVDGMVVLVSRLRIGGKKSREWDRMSKDGMVGKEEHFIQDV